MFADLELLTDVSPLKKWNVSKGEKFEKMFRGCESLNNRNILKSWKFSKVTDFESMFLN
jgi:hypothetical protein